MSGTQTNRSAITLPSEISREILQKMQHSTVLNRKFGARRGNAPQVAIGLCSAGK